jgi:signal transduction histidine kinase
VWELRPAGLDDLGLVVAVGNFVAEWSRIFGIVAEFHSRGLDDQRLTSETEINLYRIAQEALNNVYKHAQATAVSVILERRGNDVLLVIEDDGGGFIFPPPNSVPRGMGLLGMRERAALSGGTADIESELRKGTTVFVRVPLLVRKEGDLRPRLTPGSTYGAGQSSCEVFDRPWLAAAAATVSTSWVIT